MKQWLIDTNIVSEMMRRKPNTKVETWCTTIGSFYISTITIDEINYGLELKSLKTKAKYNSDRWHSSPRTKGSPSMTGKGLMDAL